MLADANPYTPSIGTPNGWSSVGVSEALAKLSLNMFQSHPLSPAPDLIQVEVTARGPDTVLGDGLVCRRKFGRVDGCSRCGRIQPGERQGGIEGFGRRERGLEPGNRECASMGGILLLDLGCSLESSSHFLDELRKLLGHFALAAVALTQGSLICGGSRLKHYQLNILPRSASLLATNLVSGLNGLAGLVGLSRLVGLARLTRLVGPTRCVRGHSTDLFRRLNGDTRVKGR